MTRPVYIDRALGSAHPHSLYVLDGEEGRHASAVRRTRVGEEIDVVDGSGARIRGVVRSSDKSSLTLEVAARWQEAPPTPDITVVQALAKGGRDEQAVETCTEYGVARIIPWEAERSVVSWKGKAEKGVSRWEATAWAATKQSRRSWLPLIEAVVTSAELTRRVAREVAEGSRVFVCHEEATLTLGAALGAQPTKEGEACVVVVGPEGGISPTELELLCAAGAQAVLLGSYVLRAASAAPFAIAAIQTANILVTND